MLRNSAKMRAKALRLAAKRGDVVRANGLIEEFVDVDEPDPVSYLIGL